MNLNLQIEDGVYEIKDISFSQKIFPLMFAYIKSNIRDTILVLVLCLGIVLYLFGHPRNFMEVFPYIIGIMLIIFIMFFALSRLLIIKNAKKQYIKISGSIIKIISEDFKNIEGYNLYKNSIRKYLYKTGNIITIILESHGVRKNSCLIKSAITFPDNCLKNKVNDKKIIDIITYRENEIYNHIANINIDVDNIDFKEYNAIKDIIDDKRQNFNNKYNIK